MLFLPWLAAIGLLLWLFTITNSHIDANNFQWNIPPPLLFSFLYDPVIECASPATATALANTEVMLEYQWRRQVQSLCKCDVLVLRVDDFNRLCWWSLWSCYCWWWWRQRWWLQRRKKMVPTTFRSILFSVNLQWLSCLRRKVWRQRLTLL